MSSFVCIVLTIAGDRRASDGGGSGRREGGGRGGVRRRGVGIRRVAAIHAGGGAAAVSARVVEACALCVARDLSAEGSARVRGGGEHGGTDGKRRAGERNSEAHKGGQQCGNTEAQSPTPSSRALLPRSLVRVVVLCVSVGGWVRVAGWAVGAMVRVRQREWRQ